MKQMLAVCPVCSADLTVTELACPACNTRIQSTFSTCRYCRLDEEQSRFLEVFLRCRGVIRDVERTLGISYPTVRGKLDALLDALGLVAEPEAEEEASQERLAVLEELDAGRITIQEAIQRLRQG